MAEDRINHWFENVNVQIQGRKMKSFLTFAFGGPSPYDGKGRPQAHAHLVPQGLDDSDFDSVMEAMGKTLTELNVPQDLLEAVAAIAQSIRGSVLSRTLAHRRYV